MDRGTVDWVQKATEDNTDVGSTHVASSSILALVTMSLVEPVFTSKGDIRGTLPSPAELEEKVTDLLPSQEEEDVPPVRIRGTEASGPSNAGSASCAGALRPFIRSLSNQYRAAVFPVR